MSPRDPLAGLLPEWLPTQRVVRGEGADDPVGRGGRPDGAAHRRPDARARARRRRVQGRPVPPLPPAGGRPPRLRPCRRRPSSAAAPTASPSTTRCGTPASPRGCCRRSGPGNGRRAAVHAGAGRRHAAGRWWGAYSVSSSPTPRSSGATARSSSCFGACCPASTPTWSCTARCARWAAARWPRCRAPSRARSTASPPRSRCCRTSPPTPRTAGRWRCVRSGPRSPGAGRRRFRRRGPRLGETVAVVHAELARALGTGTATRASSPPPGPRGWTPSCRRCPR